MVKEENTVSYLFSRSQASYVIFLFVVHKGFVIDFDCIKKDGIPYQYSKDFTHKQYTHMHMHTFANTELL